MLFKTFFLKKNSTVMHSHALACHGALARDLAASVVADLLPQNPASGCWLRLVCAVLFVRPYRRKPQYFSDGTRGQV